VTVDFFLIFFFFFFLSFSDVFRPPAHGDWLSTLVGSGVQIFLMTMFTLIFAVLGFLSPANRGGLMTALLLIFVFMGMFAGYWSTRLFKMFKYTDLKTHTIRTALFFPGVIFGIFFILNLLVWGEKSSGAVPFGTLVALLVLWLVVSGSLTWLGKQTIHVYFSDVFFVLYCIVQLNIAFYCFFIRVLLVFVFLLMFV
jgi:transmembrane 9 superfamily protein 2/4